MIQLITDYNEQEEKPNDISAYLISFSTPVDNLSKKLIEVAKAPFKKSKKLCILPHLKRCGLLSFLDDPKLKTVSLVTTTF